MATFGNKSRGHSMKMHDADSWFPILNGESEEVLNVESPRSARLTLSNPKKKFDTLDFAKSGNGDAYESDEEPLLGEKRDGDMEDLISDPNSACQRPVYGMEGYDTAPAAVLEM
jgi:hypothetical protein